MQDLSLPERGPLGTPEDRFKRRASIAVLAAAGGVAGVGGEVADASAVLQFLDHLVHQFSGERIAPQLQLDQDGGLWLSVALSANTIVPFDTLSSGQKEIISTLFLIWEATRDCPSVVLIDEPELHLHQEWHDDIMRALFRLNLPNQYIIATHSQRIAESVPPGRVMWLET
jgi:predicted ATPase